MPETTKQPSRVVALANRLRLLQVDFADQTDEVRREYLTEEVRRALGGVPPSERKAFLDELQEHFPTWDAKVDVRSQSPQSAAARPAFDEKEMKDPSFLVTRLVEVCKSLPPEQRRSVTDRLVAAGLVGVGTPEWPQAQLNDARGKLKINSRVNVDPGRVLELVAQMGEFIYSLDKAAWNTWRTMAPNSTFRRPAELSATIGRFASADQAVGSEQMGNEVRLLRQLTAALIGALAATGRIAVQHFRTLSPNEIIMHVGSAGMFGKEAAYWRKYVELYGGMDSSSIEEAIRLQLAEFAENLIRGR